MEITFTSAISFTKVVRFGEYNGVHPPLSNDLAHNYLHTMQER